MSKLWSCCSCPTFQSFVVQQHPTNLGRRRRHEKAQTSQQRRRASVSATLAQTAPQVEADPKNDPDSMGPVVSVRPVLPSTLRTVQELPPVEAPCDEDFSILAEKRAAWSPMPRDPGPTYTLFSTQPTKTVDMSSQASRNTSMNGGLRSSTVSSVGVSSAQDGEKPMRDSTLALRERHLSFESFESSSWRPNYRQRRSALSVPFVPRSKRQVDFAALPDQVLDLILDELKHSHLDESSGSCATCWMRDACSMCLCCREWRRCSQAALYVEPLSCVEFVALRRS